MPYYLTALRTEFIKKRKTATYVIAIGLGILTPIIWAISKLATDESDFIPGLPYNYYKRITAMLVETFGYFFLPLLIIITAAKITHIDHKNRGWELMETQPLSKSSIYFSKLSVLLIGNIISIFSFFITCLLMGWIISLIQTMDENAQMQIPFHYLTQLSLRLFVGSLFLSAIMLWISVAFKKIIIPILLGFFSMLGSIILSTTLDKEKTWNPFTILKHTVENDTGSLLNHFFLYTDIISVVGFIMIAVIGFIHYKNKTLKRTFLHPKNLVSFLITAVIGTGIIVWIDTPKTYKAYNQTILAGEIDSDIHFDEVILFDKFLNDTLVSIPVKEGHFDQKITTKLPLNEYNILFKGERDISLQDIVMSNNDSVYLKAKYFNGAGDITSITGTRMAENQFKEAAVDAKYIGYLVNGSYYLDKPDFVINKIYDNWHENFTNGNHYRTQDNYTPRDDFKNRAKKTMTVQYLNLWHKYLDKAKVVSPEIKEKKHEKIAEIKSHISLEDNSLINNPDYLKYVTYELTVKDTSNTDFITKSLHSLAQLSEGKFKNSLAYSILKEAIDNTSRSSERTAIVTQNIDKITDVGLQAKITTYLITKNSLAKGKPAPLFIAENLAGQEFNLIDFRGKYVVIDVWATWCGPCLAQAPYFERTAIRNKNRNDIVFIALSTDTESDKEKWYLQAKEKTKSVIQLYLSPKENDQFSDNYILNSIPRYIFIDKEGRIIDAEMNYPKNPKFEEAIERALKEKKI